MARRGEYTPSLAELRDAYAEAGLDESYGTRAAAADRAIERALTAARREAWEEGRWAMIHYQQGARHKVPYPTNPYSEEMQNG